MGITFGVGMGALLSVVGIITYVFAPRVGPNPIFGVRVGYSFASREIWDRTNRVGGALIAAIGLGLMVLTFVLRAFPLSDNATVLILTGALLAALTISTCWLVEYARKQAQASELAQQVTRVTFSWTMVAPALVTFLVLLAVAIYFYPQLPADRIATHFDMTDKPNGWMARDELFASMFGMGAFFVAINAFVIWIATREPLVAFMRWGSSWQMMPGRGLVFISMMMGFGNIVIAIALFDIGWFNTRGVHPFPLVLLPVLIVALVGVVLASFFLLGSRKSNGGAA